MAKAGLQVGLCVLVGEGIWQGRQIFYDMLRNLSPSCRKALKHFKKRLKLIGMKRWGAEHMSIA